MSRLPHRVGFTSLTLAQRANVTDLYAAGAPIPDICAHFNIMKNTVIRLRKRAGVSQQERGLSEAQGDETEAIYISGKSPTVVTKRFGIGVGTAWGYLLRRGTRMRGRNGT